MIAALMLLQFAQVDWSQIDTKQYLPLQVGNWWEYVADERCTGCPPPPDTFPRFTDTIRCEITHSKLIFDEEWFYFDNFPLCITSEISPIENIGLYVRYNDDFDLVGCYYVEHWDWCEDRPILPFTELIVNIRNDKFESLPECHIQKAYSTASYYGTDLCTHLFSLMYIPEISAKETDIIYGGLWSDCESEFYWLQYNLGLTKLESMDNDWITIWNNWYLTRAVVNGVYYSNVQDSNPTSWLELKKGLE